MPLRKTLGTLAIIALAATVTPALAEKGKSNGQGNGNSSAQGNSSASSQGGKGNSSGRTVSATSVAVKGNQGKGGLASELKGLNAVRANPNALENAAPNSQVGRIAIYRDAALVTGEKAADLADAEAALADIPVPTRSIEDIDAAIAALDPAAPDYATALAALEQEKTDADAYADALATVEDADDALIAAQEAEAAALLVASGGRTLSDEAVAYIRAVLNL